MKKKLIVILSAVCLIILGTVIGVKINATNAQPGSIQDPLITKAYLDVRLNNLRTELGLSPGTGTTNNDGNVGDLTAITQYIDTQMAQIKLDLDKKIAENAGGTGAAGYVPISVPNGVKIVCYEGTEFIVRSGKATAVASNDGMGISNVSSGKDLMAGDIIMLNNLVIVPRSDGRGFISNSNGTYVMIKGKYTIE
jgi:hypothetical protein